MKNIHFYNYILQGAANLRHMCQKWHVGQILMAHEKYLIYQNCDKNKNFIIFGFVSKMLHYIIIYNL